MKDKDQKDIICFKASYNATFFQDFLFTQVVAGPKIKK